MTAAQDPYTDPKTGVMRNTLGISDAQQLRQAESDFAKVRIAELREHPLPGQYDLKHLQAFHRHIFSDVYPWAGELRTVSISKGQSLFAQPEYIDSEGKKVFAALKADNHLKGLDREQFVDRAAHHLTEVNALHAFREGNGRAQLAMFEQMGREAGYALDFSRINHHTMVLAATLAHNKDYSFLKPVVSSALDHGQRLEAERSVPPVPDQQQQRAPSPSMLDRVTHPLQAALERRALARTLDGDGAADYRYPLGEQIGAILDERNGWSPTAPRNAHGQITAIDAAKLPAPNTHDQVLDQLERELRRDETHVAGRIGASPDPWRVAYAMVAHVEGVRAQDRQNAEDFLRRIADQAPTSTVGAAARAEQSERPADHADRVLHAALRDAQPLTSHTERMVSAEIRRTLAVQLARGETPEADARLQAGVHLHVAERNLQTVLDNRGVGSSGPTEIRPEHRRLLAAYAEGAAGRFESLTPRQQDQARTHFVDAGRAGESKTYALTSAGDVLSRRAIGTDAQPLDPATGVQRFAPERLAQQLALYDYPRNDNPFQTSALVSAYSHAQELRGQAAETAARSPHADRSAGYSAGR